MENTTIHPFPGLRPFEENEEHLFFGRERSVSQLMSRLRTSHLLAVIGTSGSGKSSLIKAGLLPSLYRGFMAQAGSTWRVALFRPGDDPIGNLAQSLTGAGIFSRYIVDDEEEDENRDDLQRKMIETTLRRSSQGLVEIVKEARLPGHENLLIVVDQFEELFRFSQLERSHQGTGQDSTVFVNLLLECIGHTEYPIYIILTMRTDFMGNCMEFRGLPEAINNGQYLIPRLTREEKREAITGPIAVGGAAITPTLLSRLLNDVGNNPDHLPIMQHALMRTWDYRTQHQKDHEPLDLHHYEAVGTMEHALSQHAEEAYAELKSQKSQTICEKMFKLLTDRRETGGGIRRPAKVKEICQVANASQKEVIKVINVFRQPGRTFLMPPSEVKLHEDSVIDISHESLMRIWTRLIDWVEQEEQHAELYLRLAKVAAFHEEGKASLWRGPELMLALKWRRENQPNAVWAQRYDPSFDRAILFLDASKKQQDLEIAEKEREQKAKIRRNRIFTTILLIATIILIYLANKAHNNSIKAQEQQKIAEARKEDADNQRKRAEEEKEEADTQRKRAEDKKKEAEKERKIAQKNELEAEKAKMEAQQNAEQATTNQITAQIRGFINNMNTHDATFRHDLAKAKELAVRSIAETNNIKLKALLALYAYDFNNKAYQDLRDNTQEIFNDFEDLNARNKPYMGEGVIKLNLRYKELQNKSKLKLPVPGMFAALRNAYIAKQPIHEDVIYNNTESWALTVTNNNSIVFNGGEGRLSTGSLKYHDSKLPDLEITVPDKQKEVFLSPASCYAESTSQIFCGTIDGRIVYWNKNQREKTKQLLDQQVKIIAMTVSTNKNCLVYSVKKKNTTYIHYLGKTTNPDSMIPIEEGNLIRALTVIEDPSDSFLIAGDAKGNIFHWDLSKDIKKKKRLNADFESIPFYALAYDASRKWLVLANSRGEILLFPDLYCKSLKLDKKISFYKFDEKYKHKGIIRTLAFSPGGRYLASGGLDGTIMLWDLQDSAAKHAESTAKKEPILTVESKGRVLSLVFTANEEYMIFSDGKRLRICPTQPELFYKMLCKLYQREKWEFTPEEWKLYFGETIKQEQLMICK